MSENISAMEVQKVPKKYLIAALLIGLVLSAILVPIAAKQFMNSLKSEKYLMHEKCKKDDHIFGKYLLVNKDDPTTYVLETCLYKKDNQIVFEKKFGWNKINIDNAFSKECTKDEGEVWNINIPKKSSKDQANGNSITFSLYDHVYGCVKDGVINKYLVNTTPDKEGY